MANTLILTPFYKPNVGGAETFAEDLAKFMSESSVVHICTIKWTKPTLWQGMNLFKGLKMFIKLNRSFKKMIKKYDYDRIYALGLIATVVCWINKVNYDSIMLALYDFKKQHWLFKRALNKANRVFVEGYTGKDDMIKVGVKPEKIIEYQHWCDQSRFQYVIRNHDKPRVLFIGRPIPIKGKHIIEKCEKLTENIEYEYVENVSYEDLPLYYQRADICVVPSLYSEGFSRVVIEAASSGCVVITSNMGALKDMVKDFGKAIKPTPERFAVAIQKAVADKIKLEGWQVKTAWYAKKHFSSKNAEVFL